MADDPQNSLNYLLGNMAKSLEGVEKGLCKVDKRIEGIKKDADRRQLHWEKTADIINESILENSRRTDILESEVRYIKKSMENRRREIFVISFVVCIFVTKMIPPNTSTKEVIDWLSLLVRL